MHWLWIRYFLNWKISTNLKSKRWRDSKKWWKQKIQVNLYLKQKKNDEAQQKVAFADKIGKRATISQTLHLIQKGKRAFHSHSSYFLQSHRYTDTVFKEKSCESQKLPFTLSSSTNLTTTKTSSFYRGVVLSRARWVWRCSWARSTFCGRRIQIWRSWGWSCGG